MSENMTAPADGGALPTANLNRRLLLTGLASLPAIAGAGSALASQAVETPDERAVRLAHELSEAMNGFMTPAGDKPGWVAHVKPSAYPGPISFSQDARPENHPDRELLALGAEFEHRWATERATSKAMSGIYTKKADKLVNQAMAHTGEIVFIMTGEAMKAIATDTFSRQKAHQITGETHSSVN